MHSFCLYCTSKHNHRPAMWPGSWFLHCCLWRFWEFHEVAARQACPQPPGRSGATSGSTEHATTTQYRDPFQRPRLWFRFVSRALCFAKVSRHTAADPTRGCPAPERAPLCPSRFWQTPSGWSSGAAYRGHAFPRTTGAAQADRKVIPNPPQIDTASGPSPVCYVRSDVLL